MTHASITHDALARAEEAKAQIQESLQHIEVLKEKLASAQREVEMQLLLTDMSTFLRDISTRNMSETQRLRRDGLKKRLDQARSA
jgi:enamine deaminase RidA (YjgF/YER057c/UK114 family)